METIEKMFLHLSTYELETLKDIINARIKFIKINDGTSNKIIDMDASVRFLNICRYNDIEYIDDLARMTPSDFANLRFVGKETLIEATDLLAKHNRTWTFKQFKY